MVVRQESARVIRVFRIDKVRQDDMGRVEYRLLDKVTDQIYQQGVFFPERDLEPYDY